MDCKKTGSLIHSLRTERGWTQQALADLIHVSDKAVSKWERGMGAPDVSILPVLARVFGLTVESLLAGELDEHEKEGDSMKNMRFFVCPSCGTLATDTGAAEVSCCGKKLSACEARKAEGEDCLSVEEVETELYISSDHSMTKDHYISFLAFVSSDTLVLKKLYPEWNLSVRLPRLSRGTLLWYCTRCGLFRQTV